jgi:N-acetylglucosamine-6-sulfatase
MSGIIAVLGALTPLTAAFVGFIGPRTLADQPPPASSSLGRQPQRPNIVFITTDDQDVGTLAYMPRLQELLTEQGMRFANAFVTTPFCSPSHASMITGQYSHNHGVMINGVPLGGFARFQELDGEASTLGTWLQ